MNRDLLKDSDIRESLYNNILKKHEDAFDTIVLNELGLLQGACRVDIAVVNGSLHGYEIKSEADTLDRLPYQEKVYSKILDKATLVVGENHLQKALEIIPDWWEIQLVKHTKNRTIKFKQYRKGKLNKNVDSHSLVQLLWKDEVINLLHSKGIPSKELRKNKEELYTRLTQEFSLKDLKDLVRNAMKNREAWTNHLRPW